MYDVEYMCAALVVKMMLIIIIFWNPQHGANNIRSPECLCFSHVPAIWWHLRWARRVIRMLARGTDRCSMKYTEQPVQMNMSEHSVTSYLFWKLWEMYEVTQHDELYKPSKSTCVSPGIYFLPCRYQYYSYNCKEGMRLKIANWKFTHVIKNNKLGIKNTSKYSAAVLAHPFNSCGYCNILARAHVHFVVYLGVLSWVWSRK